MKTKISKWMLRLTSLVTAFALTMSFAGQASARILFQNDDEHEIQGQTLTIDFDDSGAAADKVLKFGSDGTITWNEAQTRFDITDGLNVAGTVTGTSITDGTATLTGGNLSGVGNITATGVIDFSGASRMALDQGTSNPGTCTEGDIFYNTADNTVYICSATNTWSNTGPQDLEDVYSYDADNTLTTSNGAFTVNTGTNDFIVTSNDWSVDAAGALTATSLTDGTATLSSGSITNGVNGTFSGTVQGGTLTDGTATITGGAGTGFTQLTADQIDLNASTITLSGLTGTNTLDITDNVADALSVTHGGSDFMVFDTTNSSESLTITPATTVTGAATFNGGISADGGVFTVADTSGNLHTSGTLDADGATTLNGAVTLGDAAADVVTVTGTVAGANPLVFEGATANLNETTIAVTDPTADNTITLPDASGEVSLLGQTIEGTEITDGTINAIDIETTNAAGAGTDNYVITYDNTTGGFTYEDPNVIVGIPDGTTDNAILKWDTVSSAWVEQTGVTADDSNNVSVGGTLGVTGATALDGGLSMDTTAFTVADTTGNVHTDGTLDVDGVITAGSGGNQITTAAGLLDASVSVIGDANAAYTSTTIDGALDEISGSGGATIVGITDSGAYFTGSDVETALQELGAVTGSNADETETFHFYPEYPDTIYDVGSSLGKLETVNDGTEGPVYKWSTQQTTSQTMTLRFRQELPTDFVSSNDITLRMKTATATTGDNAVGIELYNVTDSASCGSVAAAAGSVADTWETATLAKATIETGCTAGTVLGAGDIVEIRVTLSADQTNSGIAYAGNVDFGYNN